MTVRVNKDSFNLREKLSELERPIGLKGSELMSADTAQEARDLVSAGRRNLVINGDMRIAQRSIGPLTVGNSYQLLDRWMSTSGFGTVEISRSDDAPEGFTYSFRHNRTTGSIVTSIPSGNWSPFTQHIEGYNTAFLNWGTSSAKSVTLSFWVKCNYSGKYSVSLNNSASFNTGSYPSTHCYVAEYYINAVNTWEYKTITIPGATVGTWAKNNTSGMQIWFELGSGSNVITTSSNANKWISGDFKGLDDQMNLYAVGNHDWKITGVQLEVGKNATEFEHRSYGEELALCERYFEKIWQNNNSQSPNSGGDGYNTIASGAYSGSHGFYVWKFRTQKRIRPSLDHAGKFRVLGGSSINNLTFNEFYSPGVDAARIRSSHSGSNGQAFVLEFDGGNSSIGYISASAEL